MQSSSSRASSTPSAPLDIRPSPSTTSLMPGSYEALYSSLSSMNGAQGQLSTKPLIRMRSTTPAGLDQPVARSLAETAVEVRNTARHLARVGMEWENPPRTVFVVAKYKAAEVYPMFIALARYLIEDLELTVMVESYHWDSEITQEWAAIANSPKIRFFQNTPQDVADIDFVVTLGGDGTVLYAASLIQVEVPPIISFHLGSLGFLTTFKFSEHESVISDVIAGRGRLNLRMRLECHIERADGSIGDLEHHVLNEVVLDRGASSYLAQLHLYVDGTRVTTVHADGIIIATPTGSTAYSLSAGGSICHPSLPGLLVTPVCPHTLSFRPLILPDSVEVRIHNPPESRSSVFAAFDGRSRVEIHRGDSVRIHASPWPVPTVCHEDATADWFDSLSRCLNWNIRESQRAYEAAGEVPLRRSLSRVGILKPS